MELSAGSKSTKTGVRPSLTAYAVSTLASDDFPDSGGPTIITRGPSPTTGVIIAASSRNASNCALVLTAATLLLVSSDV